MHAVQRIYRTVQSKSLRFVNIVQAWQTLFFGKRYSNTILTRKTDFVALAKAFGADGYKAETQVEFKKAFETALASGKVSVIDVAIDKDEMVLPMLPPGGAISDIITKV
jgi:acetolactate synthase-1/2/3 large subunit